MLLTQEELAKELFAGVKSCNSPASWYPCYENHLRLGLCRPFYHPSGPSPRARRVNDLQNYQGWDVHEKVLRWQHFGYSVQHSLATPTEPVE
jgi:hypothetical protein